MLVCDWNIWMIEMWFFLMVIQIYKVIFICVSCFTYPQRIFFFFFFYFFLCKQEESIGFSKIFDIRFSMDLHILRCPEEYLTQIAILTCSKLAAVLHCKSANLQQVQHDKSASSWQDCSKLTQAPKSPYAQLAADLSCKLYSCCIKFAANLF